MTDILDRDDAVTVVLSGGPLDGQVLHDLPVDAEGSPPAQIAVPVPEGDPVVYELHGDPDVLGLWTYRPAS